MHQLIQAIVTILALVNPIACAAIFASATKGMLRRERIMAAAKAGVMITVVLLISAFFGNRILHTFGVSLAAFSCAGGGILVFIGITMMRPPSSSSEEESGEKKPDDSSLSPLILFGASPGTITGVITVGASHQGEPFPETAVFGVLISMAYVTAVLIIAALGSRKKSKAKPGFGRQMINNYMGVIVIAMGVQFMLSGIQEFFRG
ncbi:MarC family protein [Puniceicoccus vermicola]|uniref:UPF0056 membrane protein n=1 Tax=Puniceicoccus vermicola TaxID=388746 RepID=A0A7X1AYF0_9BACT|nr:MarC family protein [Puniceicoccus vermicola]MBC2601125.1 MarC family protein [Puniceicoccus vermicola]